MRTLSAGRTSVLRRGLGWFSGGSKEDVPLPALEPEWLTESKEEGKRMRADVDALMRGQTKLAALVHGHTERLEKLQSASKATQVGRGCRGGCV
jgi:hypothetical protein